MHAKFPTFFLANAEDKTKGVAILFSWNYKFSLLAEPKNPEGRFKLAKGTIDDHIFLFISYYAPNRGQVQFFQNMFKILTPPSGRFSNLWGNSNVAFDQGLHKKKTIRKSLHPYLQTEFTYRQITIPTGPGVILLLLIFGEKLIPHYVISPIFLTLINLARGSIMS